MTNMTFSDTTEKVELFRFTDKLYILGGNDYYVYNGTTLAEVDGYIPLVCHHITYDSAGELYERRNLLTDTVRATVCPNSSHSLYPLYGESVAQILRVTYAGTTMSTSDYELYRSGNRSYLRLLDSVGSSSNDIIEVLYRYSNSGNRAKLTSCTHAAIYGGDTDSRVFLWGGQNKAVIYPSELTDARNGSQISGEYFPIDGGITVGDGNLYITGAVRQFDRLAIFTEEGAFYTYPHDDGKINTIQHFSFPILPLNSEVGATKEGGAILVENEPYAFNPTGLFRFISTTVRDERLALRIDTPEFVGLTRSFIESCHLYCNRQRGELWCYTQNRIAIYNARLKCWYCYSGIAPSIMFSYDSDVAYTEGNKVKRFSSELYTDCGTAIAASYRTVPIMLVNGYTARRLYRSGATVERENNAAFTCTVIGERGETKTHRYAMTDGICSPVVFRSHTAIGKSTYLTVEIASAAAPLTVRSLLLYYR